MYYAIKIIDRKKVKRKLMTMKVDAYSMLEREVAIMKKVNHKNIVRLFEVYSLSHLRLWKVMKMISYT